MYFLINTRTASSQVVEYLLCRQREGTGSFPFVLQVRLASLLKVTQLQAGQGSTVGFTEEQRPPGH